MVLINIREWIDNRYRFIRGFIYGIKNRDKYEKIKISIISCPDCKYERGEINSLCDHHSELVFKEVYG